MKEVTKTRKGRPAAKLARKENQPIPLGLFPVKNALKVILYYKKQITPNEGYGVACQKLSNTFK